MSIVRKRLEIQLEILFRFYDAHINNRKYDQRQLNLDLKVKYTIDEINSNLIDLIGGKFIEGKIQPTRGGTAPFTNRISYPGVKLVQSIIDQTVPELEKVKASDLQGADEKKKFSIFKEVWDNRQEIYKHIVPFVIEQFRELIGS